MAEKIKFTVKTVGFYADGRKFVGGDHEVPYETRLLRLLNHAHAAGVIEITSMQHCDPAEHGVQSQEDGERALAEAKGDWIPLERAADGSTVPGTGRWSGEWHEGNLLAQGAQ
jgi:hypothetical protein